MKRLSGRGLNFCTLQIPVESALQCGNLIWQQSCILISSECSYSLERTREREKNTFVSEPYRSHLCFFTVIQKASRSQKGRLYLFWVPVRGRPQPTQETGRIQNKDGTAHLSMCENFPSLCMLPGMYIRTYCSLMNQHYSSLSVWLSAPSFR